jgi:predicted SAM-dependent methyltransferase
MQAHASVPIRDGLPARLPGVRPAPARLHPRALLRAVSHQLLRVPPLRWPLLRALSLYRSIEGPRRLARLERSTRPLRIVVGSEGRADPGWIATEHEYLDVADASHWQRFFAKGSIDAILAEHVFEHLTPEQARLAAQHCYDHLKPGGLLRAAVPDGLHPDPAYIAWVEVGGVGPGACDHKVLYDYKSFRRVFEETGFHVRLLEYWDEQGVLRQADWDPAQGRIKRSVRFDTKPRGFRYSSVILDAVKRC